jgi:hypothetical protein
VPRDTGLMWNFTPVHPPPATAGPVRLCDWRCARSWLT